MLRLLFVICLPVSVWVMHGIVCAVSAVSVLLAPYCGALPCSQELVFNRRSGQFVGFICKTALDIDFTEYINAVELQADAADVTDISDSADPSVAVAASASPAAPSSTSFEAVSRKMATHVRGFMIRSLSGSKPGACIPVALLGVREDAKFASIDIDADVLRYIAQLEACGAHIVSVVMDGCSTNKVRLVF
jgi:hypothetical protein